MAPTVVIGGSSEEFEGKVTVYVILCAVISAFGGLIFGYDIGISGGVTAMDDFLKEFFHKVYEKKQHVEEDNYCKYDDPKLQLFTSSLYLSALISSFLASSVCSRLGRKPTMQFASLFFIVGVALTSGAQNIPMLIFGRLFLGAGVGFANQAVPLFLSEIAPTKIRGALNILFQLLITVGILIASIVNYLTSKIHPYGWRISLGLAGIPSLILGVGSMFIVETPTSLIENNKLEEGRETLRRIRGTDNIEAEFKSIHKACEAARHVTNPYRKLLKPSSRPPLVIAIFLQLFQQFTGINAIMFYAPVLFQTIGFGNDAAFLSAVITGVVNVSSTMVSVYAVDKTGRRFLLLQACVQMFLTQSAIGVILWYGLRRRGSLGQMEAMIVAVLVCLYVMAFAWSWGPLGWLIPSETFPVETRAAGFAFAVSSNMLFTFVIAQAFLTMLCQMQAGIFFFFATWIVAMGLFTLFLIPETKGVPVDSMTERVWKQHWFWKDFMVDDPNDKQYC